MDHARAFGADYLATGHYARVDQDAAGRFHLFRGVDGNKDQSYVLSVLNQELLARSLFPLGSLTKPEVRQRARNFGLPVAERGESQDLCFISDGNYRRFLTDHAPRVSNPGPIRNHRGELIGEHQGLAFYTIGQRKGIRIAAAEPYYVIGKDIQENALIVGPQAALGRSALIAHSASWIAGSPPGNAFHADVRIRYKAQDAPGLVTPLEDGRRFQVDLDHPARDITPGQGAVIYCGDECLGGGIIDNE
jgi:tRNA-specific 2-thiouridylase